VTTEAVQQWWDGLLAWLNHRAELLKTSRWTYERACDEHARRGLNGAWPLIVTRLLDEGYVWPQVSPNSGWTNSPDRDLCGCTTSTPGPPTVLEVTRHESRGLTGHPGLLIR
jgi:hypothetical protein